MGLQGVPGSAAHTGASGPTGNTGPAGIGNLGPTGATGPASRLSTVRIITNGSTVACLASDDVVVINKSSPGPTTVTLIATPARGTMVIIKDGRGDAATNNISITSTYQIDGSAGSIINSNYGAARLVFNGSQWNLI
jgi:aspartate 1-decarboxylase